MRGALDENHCKALPAGEKTRFFLEAYLENRILFLHGREILIFGERIGLYCLYFAIHRSIGLYNHL